MRKWVLILCCFVHFDSYGQNYLFYLHNMWLELHGTEVPHPEYGKAAYSEIIDKFKQEGITVISELRPKGTNGKLYAIKVAHQIDSLIKTGVPASHITVAGTSKGGYIGMCVSGILKNTGINYVLIGCCSDEGEADSSVHLFGSILSIYEKSDAYHSCVPIKNKRGNDVKRFKEIELNTGLKHGFLYKPLDEWIKPASDWSKQNYN